MKSDMKQEVILDKLVELDILEYIGENFRYTEKFSNCRESIMHNPEILDMVEENIEERKITDEKEKFEELFASASLLAIIEFGGGNLEEKDLEIFSNACNAIDRNMINALWKTDK